MSPIFHVLLGVFTGFLINVPFKVFVLYSSWENAWHDFTQQVTTLITVAIVYFVFYGV